MPSAKQLLDLRENQNWEHPPLGKELMAVGIGIVGDNPVGWRIMSTIFGALTLVGMFLWALAIFESEATALWVAMLTLCNQLLYVQARIGMLDTFMFAFLSFGLAAFTAAWKSKMPALTSRKLFRFTGLMLGLATACKWFGVIPWVTCMTLVGFVYFLKHQGVSFSDASEQDWYSPKLFSGMRKRDWILSFGLIPLTVYFMTYIPYYFVDGNNLGFWDLFTMQTKAYSGQLRVVNTHPYMSQWWDWPTLHRPIWYAYNTEGANKEWVRGVLLLGNPLIMWTGLLAILVCALQWLFTRSKSAFMILAFYGAFFVCWMVIPRKISFYYYYYPAGMVLSFAIASTFDWLESRFSKEFIPWVRWAYLGSSLGLFIYFFPILAGLKIPAASFTNWMWFRSWI